MAKNVIRRDAVVVVISGASRGRRGRVLSVDRKKNRVVVEGVNVRKKTVRRSQDNPQGGIVEVEASLHISNVMLGDRYDARRARAGVASTAPAAVAKDEVGDND